MADSLFDQLMKRAALEASSRPSSQPASPPVKEPKGIGTLAKAIYLGGAGADIASTEYFLRHPELRLEEANPLINRLPPKVMMPIGAAMEGLGVWAANKALGKKHPKILKAGLIAAGLLHGSFAVNNTRAIRHEQQKRK